MPTSALIASAERPTACQRIPAAGLKENAWEVSYTIHNPPQTGSFKNLRGAISARWQHEPRIKSKITLIFHKIKQMKNQMNLAFHSGPVLPPGADDCPFIWGLEVNRILFEILFCTPFTYKQTQKFNIFLGFCARTPSIFWPLYPHLLLSFFFRDECLRSCKGTQGCSWVTFFPNTSTCILFSDCTTLDEACSAECLTAEAQCEVASNPG